MQENVMAAAVQPMATMPYQAYEAAMQPYRMELAKVSGTVLTEYNPRTLMLFWIYFSAQGVGMTEPVERWIRRAGNRCKVLGYSELGEQLCKHAIHESNHHLMMMEDTKHLVACWNELYTPKLDAETILNDSMHQTVLAYQALHEETIDSNHPYGQIAIEYEIENLSVLYGKPVLQHTLEVLGKDIVKSLSFVDEHVLIDAAHTEYNRKAISRFLTEYPKALPELISVGKKALDAYWTFIHNCYEQAILMKPL